MSLSLVAYVALFSYSVGLFAVVGEVTCSLASPSFDFVHLYVWGIKVYIDSWAFGNVASKLPAGPGAQQGLSAALDGWTALAG